MTRAWAVDWSRVTVGQPAFAPQVLPPKSSPPEPVATQLSSPGRCLAATLSELSPPEPPEPCCPSRRRDPAISSRATLRTLALISSARAASDTGLDTTSKALASPSHPAALTFGAICPWPRPDVLRQRTFQVRDHEAGGLRGRAKVGDRSSTATRAHHGHFRRVAPRRPCVSGAGSLRGC